MSDIERSQDDGTPPPEGIDSGALRRMEEMLEEAPSEVRKVVAYLISVSIKQQVQLLMPSVIELLGDLADRHKDLAVIITNDVVERRQHRERMDTEVINGNNRRADRGQYLSWVFALLALVFGFVLLLTDRSAWGLVLVITAVVPLLSVNFLSRMAKTRERTRKTQLAGRPSGPSQSGVSEQPKQPKQPTVG